MSEQQADYITETDEALQMLGKGYNGDPLPPTEFISIMSGFTPAPDKLIIEFGYVTALVWGRTWRYCQMSDGVCRAKIETIGAGLGMSERTIIRHLDTLCEGGYLFDMTPDLRNKPHIYADTGKIRIRVSVEGGMTQSHSTMTESHREGDRESHEESTKKKESKKQKIKEGASATPKPPTPPEIKLYREVTKKYPPLPNYEDVVSHIKAIAIRLGREVIAADLSPFYKAWTGNGWNQFSISWLEYAVKNQTPSPYKKQSQPNQPPRGVSVAQSWLVRKQAEANG